ncbi:F-box domain containing protein [Tanacetum coccineum]|uniref:F-box domain containing protein n=1 Tax=Tanacetum coccineum TaxID=301880 RepID=A0ABQ4Y6U4_9ASTR
MIDSSVEVLMITLPYDSSVELCTRRSQDGETSRVRSELTSRSDNEPNPHPSIIWGVEETALVNDLSYIPPNNEHNEPTQVDIGLVAYGFNSFGNLSQAYNMWPVILTTYNLPPWLCMKESSFMLTLLIPGPKSPGKDIDVYLRPLIDDLKRGSYWTINDFPARSSLSGWGGQGYKACPTCKEDTPSVRVLSKITYVGHKRFLKKPYKWRRSLEFNGQTDNTDPPKEFGRDVILAQLDRLPTRVKVRRYIGSVTLKRTAAYLHIAGCYLIYLSDQTAHSTPPETTIKLNAEYVRSISFDLDTFFSQTSNPKRLGADRLRCLNSSPIDPPMSSADVARSHGGDGGGDDRPPSHVVPTGCGGCFANKGKGKRKPNLGGRGAGRLNTRDKTRNLSLKEIAVAKGPVPINFEQGDKQTLNPLGPHAAHWSNYIGEVVRSVPLYYPSWEKVPKERKAAIISEIGTLFDLRPHMDSSRWTEISEGINMHLQKAYNTNKASFKAKHWKADPTTGTYDVEAIRRARPEEITAAEWDKYIKFWNDPKNLARAAQNRLNRQKSVVTSRQGSRSLARLRDEMRQASDTQEYPSLIDTFWRTHTVDGVFPKDEDRRIYEEMKRLEATGEYTEDEINALARGGKLRGHIPGVGRVLPSRATSRPSMPAPDKSLKSMHRKVDFMMSLFRSDSKYSDMFKEFESGGASGSGGCGDDEEGGDDEDGDSDD